MYHGERFNSISHLIGAALALVGLLRSPALALSDVAIYLLLEDLGAGDTTASLWTALDERGGGLSGQDGARAARALGIISSLRSRVGRVSVRTHPRGRPSGAGSR